MGIRGIPIEGLGAGSSDVISVYVDDVVQSRRSVIFGNQSAWDVEQVEVLRGAQSTVQGRNALAGAIVLKTKDPSYTPSLDTRVTGGSFGYRGASVAAGGALVPGSAAWRLSADYARAAGYLQNEYLGKQANPMRNLDLRGKLLLQPSDRLDALITLAHRHHRQGNQANDQVLANPFDDKLFTNIDAYDQVKQTSLSTKLNYFLDDRWTLTSVTTGSLTPTVSYLDFDQAPTPRPDVLTIDQTDKAITQEFRLSYDKEPLRGHVSVYYSDFRTDRTGGVNTNVADFFEFPEVLAVYPDGLRFKRTQSPFGNGWRRARVVIQASYVDRSDARPDGQD